MFLSESFHKNGKISEVYACDFGGPYEGTSYLILKFDENGNAELGCWEVFENLQFVKSFIEDQIELYKKYFGIAKALELGCDVSI